MAIQNWVTGAAQFFVGLGQGGALLPLGLSEQPPQISTSVEFEDVFADVGGNVPVDASLAAEMAMITVNLGIYNESVYQLLESRLIGGTPGSIAAQGIGTLMNQEGHAFRLLLNFPYAGKNAYSAMQSCRNFPLAHLYQSYDLSPSTKRKVIHMVFRALPVINYSTGASTLWNTNNAGMPTFA